MNRSTSLHRFTAGIATLSLSLLCGCNEPRAGVREIGPDYSWIHREATAEHLALLQSHSGEKRTLCAVRINSLDADMSKRGEHFVIIFTRGQRMQIPFEDIRSFRVGGLIGRAANDEEHVDCEVTLKTGEMLSGATFTEHCGILAYEAATHREVRIPMEEIESLEFSRLIEKSGEFEL
jgi:hypothetical protein